MINVRFIHRKPLIGNFSLERLFADIRHALPPDIAATVWECPAPSQGLLPRLRNLLAAVGAQGQVTHVTGDVNYVVLLMRRRRTLLTIPDVVLLHRHVGWLRALANLVWFRLPARRVARVVTISEAVREEVLAAVGCPPEHVVAIHVPVSPAFHPDLRPFNTSRPRILMQGSAWNKNLVRQTEALAGLDVEVDFIGMLDDAHRAAFARAGVRFTQAYGLSDAEMVERYRAADLVLFASLYEGFGMPIVEAQAIGRPVVTSRASAMPEIAGDAAALVDPTDVASIRAGVRRVLDDAAYRESLIARGFENVRRFSPAAIAARYAELYREIARDRA